MGGVVPLGRGGPCFQGGTSLGICHLGNIAVQLRDSAVHPWGNACLQEGITCLGIPGLRGPKPCRAPDCLGKDHTLCLRRSAVHRGRLGTACLEDLTLKQSVIHWGSLGTACLGDLTLCLRKSTLSWGGLGTACLGRLSTACLEDSTLCLGKSAICWGGQGSACLESLGLPTWEIALRGRALST